MSVRIITDSASDISQEWAKDWNITVLPLKVRFGEEEFLDGVRRGILRWRYAFQPRIL